MIAYACQAGRVEDGVDFERWAMKGLRLVHADGDKTSVFRGASIHEGYNQALGWARGFEGLEALVLLHADLEIQDQYFPRRLRKLLLVEPDAAVVGICGARPAFGLEWWTRPCLGGVLHEDPGDFRFHSQGDHEADVVDGCLLALSPWAVQNLRFDEETYREAPWYAYDADICYEAQSRGKKVFVMDTRCQHHTRGGCDTRTFALAEACFLRKWALRGRWG